MSFLSLPAIELAEVGNQLVSGFIDRRPPYEIFTELNSSFIRATGSDYGFIGRVFRNQDGPYLKTLALSNIAWNDETRKLYAENAESGMVFDNINTIFGRVLITGKLYIANDAPNDPYAAGTPMGHPELDRFLGIPIVRNDVLIGMIGLANGNNYCPELVDELQTLIATTSHIMYATGLQQDLIPDGNYFRQSQAIINSFRSCVMTINDEGNVKTANPAASILFGYEPGEMLGLRVQTLIPPTGKEPFYGRNNELDLRPNSGSEPIEATAAKKEGSFFPVEVAVDLVAGSDGRESTFVIRDVTVEKSNERQKNEFISTVSHELRTPLTAIHLALSLLVNDHSHELEPAMRNDLMQMAHRNCERLARLVDDILDYEKLKLGKLKFNFEPVELDQIINPVLQTVSILAELSKVQIEIDRPTGPCKVTADAIRISRVLINLMTNSIRVSKAGSKIRLGFVPVPEYSKLRVEVDDEGPGIAAERISEIFQPFKQLEENQGSAGLGLAICKQIVEKHYGELACNSTIGSGTRFYFQLYEHQEVNFFDGASELQRQKSVLWVERDIQQFELAVSNLEESEQLEIHRVENSQVAKLFANENPVDLLVLAHPLIPESTQSFLRRVRDLKPASKLPVIVYSSGIPSELQNELNELGIYCPLQKSWNMKELREQISTCLRSLERSERQ